MSILILKTIHIIAVVSWFAGLFYLGRMFVYHREALDKSEPAKTILTDQISVMENRVYKIIMNPAMMLSWIFGLLIVYQYGLQWFKLNNWLHFKIILVIGLTIYHMYCKKVIKYLDHGQVPMSSFQFRLFNEVPTIFLITIVALAVFKNATNPITLFVSIIAIILVLILLTLLYKKFRTR